MARRPRRRRVLALLGWTVLALVVFTASTAGGLLAAPVDFTQPPAQRPALILDRNGKIIDEIKAPQQRVDIAASQIPAVLRDAVVAAEDRTFYSNSGIAPLSIVRATLNDLAGRPTQGGSTITQQYVKDVYVGSQHSFARKLREAALAIRLDQRLSKSEVLTRYLNEIYLGQGTYGVQAASEYYFGIPASGLSLPQASMLAGLISAPSANNPVVNPTGARSRQQYVLGRMVAAGFITAAAGSAAYARPPRIVGHASAASTSIAPQFTAAVTAAVESRYKADPDELYESGMAIHTTLDSTWQQAATAALAAVLPKATDPDASVVVMDSDTGQVLGIADKVDAAHRYVDTSQSVETSGSTIKPFTLATALESGSYTIHSPVEAPASKTYPVSECGTTKGGGPYTITNDEGGGGYYTLESALAESVNTVYGPLAITVGRAKVAATAAAAGLLSAPTAAAQVPYCSMGLGVPVTPLGEAEAYSTLADGGTRHQPSDIASISEGVDATGGGGTTVFRAAGAATRAVPADVDAQVVQAMRSVVDYGTATAAQQPAGLDVFGKTGTTDDFTEAWFSGCVPAYHVCVTTWMGYTDPRTMQDVEGVYHVAGGTLPARVFALTMDRYRASAAPVTAAPSSSAPGRVVTPTETTSRPAPATPTTAVAPTSEVSSGPPPRTSSRAPAPTSSAPAPASSPTPPESSSSAPVGLPSTSPSVSG